MRSSGCTIERALTPEAASMVDQAMNLARRLGHAHVTPLHVPAPCFPPPPASSELLACSPTPTLCSAEPLNFASTSPSTTSQPPPPASWWGTTVIQVQMNPTIPNALVAAFKRAQAHQHRGSIENQQQPLLAVKIELEQLIVSTLDDPMVGRTMREAGFSVTLVKEKVEQAGPMRPKL